MATDTTAAEAVTGTADIPYYAWLCIQALTAVSSDVVCQAFEIKFHKKLRHPEDPIAVDAGLARDISCGDLVRKSSMLRLVSWLGTYGIMGGTLTYFWHMEAVPVLMGGLYKQGSVLGFVVEMALDTIFCPLYGLVTMCSTLALERHDIAYIGNKVRRDGVPLSVLILGIRWTMDACRIFWSWDATSMLVQILLIVFTGLGMDYVVHRYQPQPIPDISVSGSPLHPPPKLEDTIPSLICSSASSSDHPLAPDDTPKEDPISQLVPNEDQASTSSKEVSFEEAPLLVDTPAVPEEPSCSLEQIDEVDPIPTPNPTPPGDISVDEPVKEVAVEAPSPEHLPRRSSSVPITPLQLDKLQPRYPDEPLPVNVSELTNSTWGTSPPFSGPRSHN